MEKFVSVFKNHKYYFSLVILFLLVSLIFLSLTDKADGFFLLNQHHSFWMNVFFVNYTFFGDGIFTIGLCAFLYYKNHKSLLMIILVAFASSGLCVQVLKNIIYSPRPQLYFEATQYRFIIDGWGNSGGGTNGFPSGHTTSAFALATILSAHFRKKGISTLLFMGAILVGYSRIYLAKHFPVDVFAGTFIGAFFGTATLVIFQFRRNRKLIVDNSVEADIIVYPASIQTAV